MILTPFSPKNTEISRSSLQGLQGMWQVASLVNKQPKFNMRKKL